MAKRIFIIGLIALIVTSPLIAQVNCSEQLRQAERRFDEGLLDDIPQMISSCLESGFTKEERVNAHKLLIQTYLFTDQFEKADNEMFKFLKSFPEYRILQTDPKEFVTLHSTYRTEPFLKIEASLGTSYTLPFVKEFYGVEDLNTSYAEYSSNLGVFGEVNYIDKLWGDFDGSFGLSFSYLRIGYWNELYDFSALSATYNNFYIGLPLALRYNKRLIGQDFFAKGGFEVSYLLYSTIDFTREISVGQDPIIGTESIASLQQRFDFRPLISVGWNYKIGNANLMLTAGVKFGTFNATQKTKRYSNADIYEKYYFLPDDFFIHQTFVNISYVFSIYNPKKIH